MGVIAKAIAAFLTAAVGHIVVIAQGWGVPVSAEMLMPAIDWATTMIVSGVAGLITGLTTYLVPNK